MRQRALLYITGIAVSSTCHPCHHSDDNRHPFHKDGLKQLRMCCHPIRDHACHICRMIPVEFFNSFWCFTACTSLPFFMKY